MKMNRYVFLLAGIVIISLCGCSDKDSEYFATVTEAVGQTWTGGGLWAWPINDIREKLSDTIALDGGGHEEDGIFVYYIREDDVYYQFDLSKQISNTGQRSWQDAGAFRNKEDNTTFLFWYDFDIDNTKTPDLAVVEFAADDPENYVAQLYELKSEDTFSTFVNGCYGMGDILYVMWHDNQGNDRLSAIDHEKGQIQDLSKETLLVEAYAKEHSSASYVGQYCVLSESDSVTVYGADVREASDVPPVSLVFMAVKDGNQIAGRCYDLTSDEIPSQKPYKK